VAEEQRVEDLGRLEWLSSVDPLTGLFNRRHLTDLLDSRGVNDDASSAVALIDVDFFKRINDAYGHSTGDGVLRAVARRLRAATRGSDLIARWGGEEFCVLLGEVQDDADLEARAEQLRRAVRASPIALPDTPPVTVTVSVGVARSGMCRRIDDLFARADSALYEAKHAGRNLTRVALADRHSTQTADAQR
jgi:diguanylate cyclase (GGDEF)-like protein